MTVIALWAAIGFLGVAAQSAISFFRKPQWVSKDAGLDANWRRLAIYSGIAGILTLGATLALVLTVNSIYYTLAITPVIAFVLFQSFFTDLRLRYVDRWIMRVANLIALGVGIYLMLTYGSETETVIFAVFAVVATALIFMPGMGDSDGRAFQLLIFSIYPIFGIDGVKNALVGMILSVIIYYVITSLIKRNWNIRQLLTKVSFPMVPLILFPVLIIVLFGRWIPTF